jgi:hypothetical protein
MTGFSVPTTCRFSTLIARLIKFASASNCERRWHEAEFLAGRQPMRKNHSFCDGVTNWGLGGVTRALTGGASPVAFLAFAAVGLSLACGDGALVSPARAQTWNDGVDGARAASCSMKSCAKRVVVRATF